MKCRILALSTIAALTANLACSKKDDDEKGDPIGAVEIEPPVSRNMPEGFKDASLKLVADDDMTSALNAIKSLIYPTNGFVGPAERLGKLDDSMAELDARAQDSTPRACLADTVESKAYNPGGDLPAEEKFTVKLQCQENVDDSDKAQVAFGLTDDDFFIFERTSTSGVVVMASANLKGTATEVWDVRVSDDNTQFLHISASDDAGIEVVTAGTDTSGNSGATACGVHFKSDGKYLYMTASLAESSGCTTEASYCLNAETLASVTASKCTDLKLDDFELTSLTSSNATSASKDAEAMVAKKITGYIDFTKEEVIAEE